MSLFGRRRAKHPEVVAPVPAPSFRSVPCPICAEALLPQGQAFLHALTHAVESDKGYYFECACGVRDGYWPVDGGAAAGLMEHFEQAHDIPTWFE